jgi:BolA protein
MYGILSVYRLLPIPDGLKRGKHAGKNTMKSAHDALLERFRQAFPEAMIQIEEESKWHTGHADADHYQVRVLDARFNGLHRIARHSLIYNAVSNWTSDQVYALNIIPMTLQENAQAKGDQHAAARFDIEYVTNMFYVDF